MRRAIEVGAEQNPRPTKQAMLGNYFQRVDGLPISPPKNFKLACPYCTFVSESEISMASLPGALSVHVQIKHPEDFLDASIRLQSALSYVNRTMFDFEPMHSIPEEDAMVVDAMVVEELANDPPGADEQVEHGKGILLRKSYTLKQKFLRSTKQKPRSRLD